MAGGKGSGADDFAWAQGLVGKTAGDGGAKFGEAESGTFEGVLAGTFFDELPFPALQHAKFETSELFEQLGNAGSGDGDFFSDEESGVKAEGGDEIRGLKFPIGIRAIDDLESQGEPVCGGESGGGLERLRGEGLLDAEDDFGLDF